MSYLHPLGVWDSASKARDKTDDKTDELSTPAGKSGTQPQRHETRQMTRQMSYLHPLGVWDSASKARDKTDDKTDELSTPAGSMGLAKETRQMTRPDELSTPLGSWDSGLKGTRQGQNDKQRAIYTRWSSGDSASKARDKTDDQTD
eukprot:gene18052-24473_t